MTDSVPKAQLHSETSPEEIDLIARVKSALSALQPVGGREFRVSASHGTIKLRGDVTNGRQRDLVVDAIRRVAGVLRVDEQLTVENMQLRDTQAATGSKHSRPENRRGQTTSAAIQDHLQELPVLNESLEDVIAAHQNYSR